MLGRTNAGGGAALNFRVVGGTTQPTGAERLIWVNTPETISSWAFSATQPESPAAGMVWFKTGTASAAAMSAVRDETIMVYPVSCMQYISGTWESKVAKTYLSNAWVSWELAIYTAGDESGWTGKSYKYGTAAGLDGATPTVTFGESSMQLSISNYGSGGVYYDRSGIVVSEAVDLSAYSTVTFNLSSVSKTNSANVMYAYVSQSNSAFSTDDDLYVSLAAGDTQKTIDVSALSGNYYIGFLLYAGKSDSATSSVTVTGIAAV